MNATRALVLGGGGIGGIAWETGILAALADAGTDWSMIDLVVGTSAGATVAAQLTSTAPLADLYRAQSMNSAPEEPPIEADFSGVFAEAGAAQAGALTPAAGRRMVARLALRNDRVPEAERRALIERRLPSHEWPSVRLALATVAATSGELVSFDATSGVSLIDAVAASCAIPFIWPAVTIGDDRYVDGGIRSMTNEDLAEGYERVLVLEPVAGPASSDVKPLGPPTAALWLRPDSEAAAALTNPLSSANRSRAARAGYRQGEEFAARVRKFWGATSQ